MTLVGLVDALAKDLRGVLKNFTLEAEYQGAKKIAVYEQNLPTPDAGDTFYPCVVVSAENVVDDGNDTEVLVLFTIGVYGGENERGWRDLFNVAEKIRQYVLLHGVVGEVYARSLPLEFEVLELQEQPAPFFIGRLGVSYKIPTLREVLDNA